MTHLPNYGDKIKVWPDPKRKVADAAPLGETGTNWMNKEGKDVIWNEFRYHQYLVGDLHFFDPTVKADE